MLNESWRHHQNITTHRRLLPQQQLHFILFLLLCVTMFTTATCSQIHQLRHTIAHVQLLLDGLTNHSRGYTDQSQQMIHDCVRIHITAAKEEKSVHVLWNWKEITKCFFAYSHVSTNENTRPVEWNSYVVFCLKPARYGNLTWDMRTFLQSAFMAISRSR